jgi:hypothetical protein
MQETPMRAAAFAAGSLVAIGAYLSIAAAFAFTSVAIGLGVLGISLVAAVAFVAGDVRRPTPARETLVDPYDFI